MKFFGSCLKVMLAIVFMALVVDSFQIVEIKYSPIQPEAGETVKLKCQTNTWFEFCVWRHNDRVCEFEWKRSHWGVQKQTCTALHRRVEFTGNYETHECEIQLKNIGQEDAGIWSCELESYALGPARGSSDKANITVEVISSPTSSTTTTPIVSENRGRSSIDENISDTVPDQTVTSLETKSENLSKKFEKTLNETEQSILESRAVEEERHYEQETPIRENLDETDASSQIIETLEPFAEVEPESEVEPRSEVEPESEEQLADHSSLIGIVVAVVSLGVLTVAGAFALVAYRKRKAYKVEEVISESEKEHQKQVELGQIFDDACDLTFQGSKAIYSIKEEQLNKEISNNFR